jgi:hypothetical protein
MEGRSDYIEELRSAQFEEARHANTENRKDEKKRYSGKFDCRILTQCMFCYRFHLQDPTGRKTRLHRHCPDCKKRYENWRKYLHKKSDILQSDIYRDGFYRFQEP